jgi:hypothetical protein
MGSAIRGLVNAGAWPLDAAVRRWAGSLCHGYGERAAARAHFAAALSLESTPELRVHVAVHEPELTAPFAAALAPWETTLIQALRDLRAGEFARANPALEKALVLGAPPVMVLPGLWEAARRLDRPGDAALAREALLGMTHVDPATERLLAAAS